MASFGEWVSIGEVRIAPEGTEPPEVDPVDRELAELIAEDARRAELDDAAATLSGFFVGLTDRGMDSYAAAVLTDRLATGNLDPRAITKRWRR